MQKMGYIFFQLIHWCPCHSLFVCLPLTISRSAMGGLFSPNVHSELNFRLAQKCLRSTKARLVPMCCYRRGFSCSFPYIVPSKLFWSVPYSSLIILLQFTCKTNEKFSIVADILPLPLSIWSRLPGREFFGGRKVAPNFIFGNCPRNNFISNFVRHISKYQ